MEKLKTKSVYLFSVIASLFMLVNIVNHISINIKEGGTTKSTKESHIIHVTLKTLFLPETICNVMHILFSFSHFSKKYKTHVFFLKN